jgi:hypothetical protein
MDTQETTHPFPVLGAKYLKKDFAPRTGATPELDFVMLCGWRVMSGMIAYNSVRRIDASIVNCFSIANMSLQRLFCNLGISRSQPL